MNPSRKDAETVVDTLLKLPSEQERKELLNQTCGGDAALRQEVQARLKEMVKAGLEDRLSREEFERAAKALAEIEEPAEEGLGATTQPMTAAVVAGARIGRYKLLEQIGEGGFGLVYMAEQVEPVQRKVALKVIKAGMDSKEVIARFEAERQALALMDHPNIARVLDAGTTEAGRPYFVMELVRGIPVTDFCDLKKLSFVDRLGLFMKVCQAVQHAHQKGIIHRDIKPNNVLVTLHDGEPVPKVIDFGIAKALGQKLTEKTLFTGFGQFMGTPAYMSPEQAELSGLDIDTRSDIYSLGVLLYELLTGVTPFDRETLAKAALDEIRRMIRETEPAKPSTRLQTLGDKLAGVAQCRHTEPAALSRLVHGDLDWIVMKCLEKDRGRRYESANGLARDLHRHLNQEPVEAAAPSARYRLKKLVRRNKLAFAATSAVTAALIVGFAVSTWQFLEKNRALQRAVAAEQEQASLVTEKTDLLDEQARLLEQANEARNNEEMQRKRAQASEAEARHSLYVLQLRSVRDAWENKDMPRMREVLDQARTYSDRGFEWRYWQRRIERRRLRGLDTGVVSLILSPAGDRALGNGGSGVALWDWASGQELFGHPYYRLYNNEEALLRRGALSPRGDRIAMGMGRAVEVYDVSTAQRLLTLSGPTNHAPGWRALTSLAYSPDGRWIAAGNQNTTTRIWDASTGRELFTLGTPTNRHFELDLSTGWKPFTSTGWKAVTPDTPTNRGGQLSSTATGSVMERPSNGLDANRRPLPPSGIRLADGHAIDDFSNRNGEESEPRATTRRPYRDHARGAVGHRYGDHVRVSFAPDSTILATASSDGSAILWDLTTGERISALETGVEGIPTELVFFKDGHKLLLARANHPPSVWEVPSGKLAFHIESPTETVTTEAVTKVAVSLDGRFIVTAIDRAATLWDASTGALLRTFEEHPEKILSMAISPDGQRVATAGKTVKLWEAATGREFAWFRGETHPIYAMAFSSDGGWLLTGGAADVRVWQCPDKPNVVRWKVEGQVQAAAFSPVESRIAIAQEQTIGIWDATSGRLLHTLAGHSQPVIAVSYSPDGKLIASGSRDGSVRFWDAESGVQVGKPISHPGVRLWDPESGVGLVGKSISLPPINPEVSYSHPDVQSVAFSQDGGTILATSPSFARAWDVQTRRLLAELRSGDDAANVIPEGVIVSSQDAADRVEDILVVPLQGSGVYSPNIVRAFDTRPAWAMLAKNEVVALPKTGNTAVCSPDGQHVLVGGEGGSSTAVLRGVDTGGEILPFMGHADEVLSVAISPDGRRVLTGSRDGTARLWDAASGDQLLALESDEPEVSFVAFSFNGSTVALGSTNGVFTVYESSVRED